MQYAESTVLAHDSIRLFVRTYRPDEQERSGRTLVLVHGTSEHGGRYEHVAQMTASHGWDVIVADLRGHGRSDGVPVHVERFEQYLHDLDTLWQYFELNPSRTALLGHSFGALVSLRYAQTRPHGLASLTLLSPLLKLKVPIDAFTLWLGRLMSFIAPRTRFQSRVPSEFTTRNPEVLQRRELDRLIHRSVTAAWFFEMKRALQDAWHDAKQLQTPVLALQAGADLIVDPSAVEPWIQSVGSSDRMVQVLDGRYHELLNEPDWQLTLAHVLEWLHIRIPGPTAQIR